MQTHESYIHQVRDIVLQRATESERKRVMAHVKLVYGAGSSGLRGVTYFDQWQNGRAPERDCFVEICAFGESSLVQVAGTTVHELAHVLAGPGAGHSREWKATADRLGLRLARANGHRYNWAYFDPTVREQILALEPPVDGAPGSGVRRAGRSCIAGVGTRGGSSRGPGSGSRMLKVQCAGCGYLARVTQKWLDVGAPICPTCAIPMES